VKALRRLGVKLNGDLMIAAVAGEIEKTQVGDEFSGREYRGYGVGTHYLVNHGNCARHVHSRRTHRHAGGVGPLGSMWARFTVHGLYVHTAFSQKRQRETSVSRMQDCACRDFRMGPHWESHSAYRGQKGIVNIGCIRAGQPWRTSRTPENAEICLDLRVPPTLPLQQARRIVKDFLLDLSRPFS